MTNKRQFVLYALGALAVLALGAVFLALEKRRLSHIPDHTNPVATTTTTAEVVATSSPRQAQSDNQPVPQPFRFEIVSTDALRAKGLGGREEIPPNYGMLFVFPEKQKYGFWMKDMKAAIDIIWISDAKIVLGVEEAVSPGTYPDVFYPPEPVRYVLETRAGEARRLGIMTGTKLNLPLPGVD